MKINFTPANFRTKLLKVNICVTIKENTRKKHANKKRIKIQNA